MRTKVAFGGGVCYQKLARTNGTCGFRQYAFVGNAGEKIATQKLNNNRPDQFYDEVHPLPEKLTQGKERVTVRFQAHPGNTAGGVFGVRTMRLK